MLGGRDGEGGRGVGVGVGRDHDSYGSRGSAMSSRLVGGMELGWVLHSVMLAIG